MGQDTYHTLVLSTKPIPLTKENLALIRRLYASDLDPLFQSHELRKSYSRYSGCDDEVCELESASFSYCIDCKEYDDDNYIAAGNAYASLLIKLMKSQTEDEFETHLIKLKEMSKSHIVDLINKSELAVWFQLPIIQCDARNISRRVNPQIYAEYSPLAPVELAKKITTGMAKFADLGVPEGDVKLGYIFCDSV